MSNNQLEEKVKQAVKNMIVDREGEDFYYALIGQRIHLIRYWKGEFKDLLNYDKELFNSAVMFQLLLNQKDQSDAALAIEAVLIQTALETEAAL